MAYTTTVSYTLFSVSPPSPNAFAVFSMTTQSPREHGYISPYYEVIRTNTRQSESSVKSRKSVFGRIFGGI